MISSKHIISRLKEAIKPGVLMVCTNVSDSCDLAGKLALKLKCLICEFILKIL